VTLELRLENLRQVPTTIAELELTLDVTYPGRSVRETFTGKFLEAPPYITFFVQREFVPGAVSSWNQPPLDKTITSENPLTYGSHKDCWARFYVGGLQLDDYKNATIQLKITSRQDCHQHAVWKDK